MSNPYVPTSKQPPKRRLSRYLVSFAVTFAPCFPYAYVVLWDDFVAVQSSFWPIHYAIAVVYAIVLQTFFSAGFVVCEYARWWFGGWLNPEQRRAVGLPAEHEDVELALKRDAGGFVPAGWLGLAISAYYALAHAT